MPLVGQIDLKAAAGREHRRAVHQRRGFGHESQIGDQFAATP
jgi:hypothetical protein